MENASKALIIAGAILLAILIIGLGVFIYNQAANTMNDTGMDQLAVQQFNAKFESYIGTQSGAQIKNLLQTVISNNYTYSDDDSMKVTVNKQNQQSYDSIYDLSSSQMKKVGDGTVYKVTINPTDRNEKNGIIKNITIVENVLPVM